MSGYGAFESLAVTSTLLLDTLEPHQKAASALLWARGGEHARAHAALDAVFTTQVHAPGRPWDSTFAATPTGLIAWLDGWDPNSRSLVGLVLSAGLATCAWKPDLADRSLAVLVGLCYAEEVAARLPVTYTNIALAHAANCAVAGALTGDLYLTGLADGWVAALHADLTFRGGVMEHASPTYGGVALAAASLLADTLGPGPGSGLLAALSDAVLADFAPELGELTGPWVRAYGLRLYDHVALTGVALARHHRLTISPAAAHGDDWPMVSVIAATDAGRLLGLDRIPAMATGAQVRVSRRDIAELGTVTAARSGLVAWGGLAGPADAWHHQTYSSTVHTRTAALGLCDPRVAVRADGDGLHITIHAPSDGAPTWLWGTLPRPVRLVPPPAPGTPLAWRPAGAVQLVSPHGLQVGDALIISPTPWGWDGRTATLPPVPGTLNIILG